MSNILRKPLVMAILVSLLYACHSGDIHKKHPDKIAVQQDEEEHEGYDEAAARDRFEFERIKDPSLGYVPLERMLQAVDYTEDLKAKRSDALRTYALSWTERGPIFDTVGPSNGNTRGANRMAPGTYTSGRTRAILIDTLNDPSGNTVFCGGIAGGLWKCTNFLTGVPNWQNINDRFDNLAISSICQDPTNPAIMYFSTGEPTSNADAVNGLGLWKSSNGGTSWIRLPQTANLVRTFKLMCDAQGNVYAAERVIARSASSPVSQTLGLVRSKDQGATWENITPNNLTSTNASCTDIEISSTGKLHASFGYNTGGTNRVQHLYTATPATVSPGSWNTSTGLRNSTVVSLRLELAAIADTLYGVTVNSSSNLDSVYKSIDGGATWTRQNASALPTEILNGQGWYNLTLAINPINSREFIAGGLDAYRFTNSGVSAPTRLTYWVGPGVPYVHADHHFMQWWMVGNQSRIVIGCDGGVYLSNNAGATWTDKNRNLAIKQFYDAGIHPAQGSPYIIAGAQDNGTHQLKNPGLSYSTEVTGGDGCFVHINQQNPQIQFATYVYNQYRRSVDGGATWSQVNLSGTMGDFVNQYDYDGGQNILYASWAGRPQPNRQIIRWRNAHASNTDTSILTLNELVTTNTNTANNATVLKVSPYTTDRVFVGGNKGAIVRLDNASSVSNSNASANSKNISGANFDSGYVSCVNVGSSDSFLVATFSSYGVKHVWFSNNAGTSWTNIDGTPGAGGLPDMPVRWAIFDPQSNSKLLLATEAGVYTTGAIEGANTVWTPETNFPTVRTDMLRLRLSDNTVVAATHGRGVFTAVLPSNPEIRFNAPSLVINEGTTAPTTGCRNYRDYNVDVSIISPPNGDATITYNIKAGNTAVEGMDFDWTANGSFTNSTKQQVFTNGVLASKIITLRIYDDAEVETPETFVISFDISGSTNAAAGSAATFTVSIKDDDLAPVLPTNITQNATIGSLQYYLTTGNTSFPMDQRLSSRRSQFLFTPAELLSRGLRAGRIESFTLTMTHVATVRSYSNFMVKMGLTTRNVLYDSGQAYVPVTTTLVKNRSTFTPVVNNSFASNSIKLDAPFTWDGTSSLVVELCYNNGNADSSGTVDRTIGYADETTSKQSNFIWQNNIDCDGAFDAGSGQFGYYSGLKPTIGFTEAIDIGTMAATTLNNSDTENFRTASSTNDLVFYAPARNYTPAREILAKFKNTSNSDYGCTQVVIDRAGTGVSKFWSDTDTSSFLMNKTYRVLPTTNDPAGTYEATFYFSREEKEGWEAATKQSFQNIRIIKLPGQVSAVSASNPAPDGPGTVQVIEPTNVGNIGHMYFVTANISGGFSGFGFGIPLAPLPITLLNFDGKLQNDHALLDWSTSSEANSKQFDLEKSYDGVNYRKLITVKAAGNSSSKRNYNYTDKEFAAAINYYRLNLVDADNKSRYSNVVLLKNPKTSQGMFVINNPFSTYLDIRFGKTPAGRVRLQLTDAAGKLVEKVEFNSLSQSVIRFNLTSNLTSKGVYILSADLDGKRYTAKVMRQ
ncbi:T9SS type A sorting domain-containing protein [Segetibacter sp. 3557_3]|uniref:T9SS type A sorting domain-containing protein n=1 Tax=Segetibacter sp. 3557_3 TaxID=2547429 RepID=UPI001058811D|nr:T9SS type A sorting domain-containing protein [Segetibacter sp. 3557_3]TDH29166.1 T9SS type A sorting domain-containing protein [Segetibacter sp. 3557_3]